jgi:hypothetical protein
VDRVVNGVPQGSRQMRIVHPPDSVTMHRRGAVQSSEMVQFSSSVNAFTAQKQFPSTSCEHRQDPSEQPGVPPQFADEHPKQSVHGVAQVTGLAAKAGVSRLVMIGADQAIAAPAPIRLSILLREMRALASDRMAAPPNRWLPSQHPSQEKEGSCVTWGICPTLPSRRAIRTRS